MKNCLITSTRPIFSIMANIFYLSVKEGTPSKGYWDMAFLEDIILPLPEGDRQVVFIPGAYQGDVIDQINQELAKFSKVLVFITSDEEGKFDQTQLQHPDMIVYRQYGYGDNLVPIGYPPQCRPQLKSIGYVENRDIKCFYSGQLNSKERMKMFSNLAWVGNSILFGTDGFSKGLKESEYYEYMSHAIYAPAPGGHVSPDSFRFYEAMEAGCCVIFYPRDYVRKLFGELPPSELPSLSWWLMQKYLLRNKFRKDLGVNEAVTFVVPTSVIPSHPSTEIIEATIKSIRYHTTAEILITIDGVRGEQLERYGDYAEYIRRLLWKCNFEWENVTPIIFPRHVHQSGMIKEVIKHIHTPLLMYVEHDTPLVTDEPIDWEVILNLVMSGEANVVRFHYEARIPQEHEYLMLPEKSLPEFIATKQWSQRPHIAKTAFYQNILQYFTEQSRCFIEDRIYGNCVEGNWDDWRVFIYAPQGNIKRSLNLDGRESDRKFDKEGEQIW